MSCKMAIRPSWPRQSLPPHLIRVESVSVYWLLYGQSSMLTFTMIESDSDLQIDRLANEGAAQYDAAKERLAQDVKRYFHTTSAGACHSVDHDED